MTEDLEQPFLAFLKTRKLRLLDLTLGPFVVLTYTVFIDGIVFVELERS